MSDEIVFLYGTLRKNCSNHFRMAGAEFLGAGSVDGKIYKVGWYPALICGIEGKVRGEVYSVSKDLLIRLDRFEGIYSQSKHAHEYHRIRQDVSMDDQGSKQAWLWEWFPKGNAKPGALLKDGDWLNHEPNPTVTPDF